MIRGIGTSTVGNHGSAPKCDAVPRARSEQYCGTRFFSARWHVHEGR